MVAVSDLLRDRSVRRPRIIGSIAEVVGGITTVAWTIALARSLVALVERDAVAPWLLTIAVLTVVRSIAVHVRTLAMDRAADATTRNARAMVVDTMLDDDGIGRASLDSAGSPTTIAGPIVDDLDPWMATYLPSRLAASTIPIAVAIVILMLDPLSALVLAFAGPMLVALLALIGRVTRDRADRRLGELEWLRELTLDMVRGIPTLRVFGRVDDATATIRDTSERFATATMDVLRTAFQTSLVIEWAATAATALVAVEVALRLADGDLGFPVALTVLVLTPEFFAPLRRLASEYHAGRAGDAAIARLDATLTPTTRPQRVVPTTPTPSRAPTIRFRGVGVADGTDRPRLHHLDLTIASGTTLGVIGPSGSGKSTLASLVIGAIEPTHGIITVDDVSLASLDRDAWRSRISIVTQRPFLLSGTIAENIAISDPTADRHAIERVAHAAMLDDLLGSLPDGLDTHVGTEGSRLSGGERQRIAVARALLRDAPVVVLDEFTAHLDPETERGLIDAMRDHLAGRTAIVIAHRSATLDLAHHVVELDDGRLTGSSE